MPRTKKSLPHRRKLIGSAKATRFIVVGGILILAIGFTLHFTSGCKTLGSLFNGKASDLRITSPCEGASVSRSFILTGVAPVSDQHESVSIEIDNTWIYLPPSGRKPSGQRLLSPLQPGKKFRIPIDLTGDRAIYLPVDGGIKDNYETVTAGKHKLTVSITFSGGTNLYIAPGPSASLTLNFQ